MASHVYITLPSAAPYTTKHTWSSSAPMGSSIQFCLFVTRGRGRRHSLPHGHSNTPFLQFYALLHTHTHCTTTPPTTLPSYLRTFLTCSPPATAHTRLPPPHGANYSYRACPPHHVTCLAGSQLPHTAPHPPTHTLPAIPLPAHTCLLPPPCYATVPPTVTPVHYSHHGLPPRHPGGRTHLPACDKRHDALLTRGGGPGLLPA